MEFTFVGCLLVPKTIQAPSHRFTSFFQWLSGECYWVSPVAQLVKNLPTSAGDARDVGSIPGSGRSPGEGNGNLLQYSCLENSVDGGAWWATVHGVTKSDFTFTFKLNVFKVTPSLSFVK